MSEPKTNETQDNDSNVSRLINEETRPLDIKNYSNWTKEELIAEINKLKKRKKYGIVWEEKEEIVVKESEAKLPVLNELANLSLIFEPRFQTDVLIEGDNYHALSVLNYTHKGKIDAIYIDPPFNTGARNWKYNNDYVDKNDTFRHSKWISMMEKRLKLAKPLLKDDGVLICAIDENELWHLGMLLEELFFDREVHLITIVHNPRGVQGENFSYVNEFAFFVIPKHKKIISTRKLKQDEIYWSNLRNWGGESDRTDAKNCFYPIIVKGSEIIDFGEVATADYHPPQQTEVRGDLSYVWPIDVKGNEKK